MSWEQAAEEGRRQAELNQQLERQRQNEDAALYQQRQIAYENERRRQEELARQQRGY